MSDWHKQKEQIIREAHAAYGHATDDIVDMLARMVSNQRHHSQERLEALNLNAKQARQIAALLAQARAEAEGRQ